VEGDEWQRRGVVHEGDGSVGQSRDGVVSLPRVPGLVRSRAPGEVEEEIRLEGNFPTHYQGGGVGRECREGPRKPCCGGVYLWGGPDES